MSPLLIIVIPLALTIIGITLNSFQIVHDQPAVSLDGDPAAKPAAERRANDQFFQLQRARYLKRQKRIGQYGWLVLAVFRCRQSDHGIEANQRDSDIAGRQ